ncbi:predicted protein [Histoplasma mississippiense (nom. inval.)]|uniref:predicted protein n=1 Tax=Ajellomyces capsulatus (strain NAm1 / WU24) TaxID=2059318 RepID=UPI000157D4FA|nr:predicted protein [Histoplasma mississippiense (nom. inval.)]EDN05109.1 predicted protein [Histoplasma mississippiense (nom. inval.)]
MDRKVTKETVCLSPRDVNSGCTTERKEIPVPVGPAPPVAVTQFAPEELKVSEEFKWLMQRVADGSRGSLIVPDESEPVIRDGAVVTVALPPKARALAKNWLIRSPGFRANTMPAWQ